MKKFPKRYLKKKKISFKERLFLLFFCFLISSFGIFYLLFFYHLFQIKEIEVKSFFEKKQNVKKEEILNLAKKKIKKNFLCFSSQSIFLANLREMEKSLLENFPQLKEVKIKRKLPNKILIEVKERKPIAIFCFKKNQNCALIDKEGKVIRILSFKEDLWKLPKVLSENGNLKLKIGKTVLEKENVEKILEIEKYLKKEKIDIEKFEIFKEKLVVFTLEGWQVFFDLSKNISEQIFSLIFLLKERFPIEKRKNLEYIDLRFGNKIFFK